MLEEKYRWIHGGIIRSVSLNRRVHESFVKVPVVREDAALAWWQHYLHGSTSKIESNVISESLPIVDLFCGSGGLALGLCEGLRASGLNPQIELAVDVDKEGLEVYSYNLKPRRTLQTSVTGLVDFQIFGQHDSAEFAYEPAIMDDAVGDLKNEIAILCAGPPCQGHSNLNNHSRRNDPRNLLYLSVPAFAIALNVPVVIIENVPDVVSDKFGVVKTAIRLLQNAGYAVTDHVVRSSTLGCAQLRRRYFLIASKLGSPYPLAKILSTLKKDPVSVGWAIGDLLDTPPSTVYDSAPSTSAENQKRIDFLFEEDIFDLPNSVRPDCHKNGHTYGSVYGRLDWDKPAQTITTGFLSPGRGRYIHPIKRRVLTPHEAARLQAFPDTFNFLIPHRAVPSRQDLSKWIGDAVPSVMGYAAGLCAATAWTSRIANQ